MNQKNEDVKENSESSTEKTSEDYVPYSRFKEVNDGFKQTKEVVDSLKSEIETLKNRPAEEEEPLDWKEAESRAVNKAVEKAKAELRKEQEQQAETEKTLEKQFDYLTAMGKKVSPAIRKSILERVLETGNNDVIGYYLEQSKNFETKMQSERQKKEAFIPPTQKSTDNIKNPSFTYAEIHNKSLDDLVSEASI